MGNAQDLMVVDTDNDAVGEVVGDFGPLGLWLWNAGVWTELSALDADLLAKADTDGAGGEEVVADFGGLGLWLWKAGVWSQISGAHAENVVAGNVDAVAGEEVFADFGALGLWKLASGIWTQISSLNADFMIVGDVNDDSPGRADGRLRRYRGYGSGTTAPGPSCLPLNTDALGVADTDADHYGEIVADFGTTGMRAMRNNGTWTQIE